MAKYCFVIIVSFWAVSCRHQDNVNSPARMSAKRAVLLNKGQLSQCTKQHLERRRENIKNRKKGRKTKKTQKPSFVKVQLTEVNFKPFARTNLIEFRKSLRQRIKRCSRAGGAVVKFDGRSIGRKIYCKKTSEKLLALARTSNSMEVLLEKMKVRFNFYRHELVNSCKLKSKQEAMLTSYLYPFFNGSKTRTAKYKYPFFAEPTNLSKIKKNNNGVYYTRQEINAGKSQAPVLAYLENELDIYSAQIQGSMRVKFDGTDEYQSYGYSGRNGYLLAWLGPIMQCMGVDKSSTKDGKTIREYFEKNPRLVPQYMSQVKYYSFFAPVNKKATGSFGLEVLAGHSLAIDPRRIPYGAIGLLTSALPVTKFISTLTYFSTIALFDDTGSAIAGDQCALRADYFAGSSDEARIIAETMHQPGNIYLVLPKNI